MFEFILLFIFFWWLFSRNEKRKERKRKLFKPSLDQELKELIQAEDNSTGIALSVKQYLLDVLDDDGRISEIKVVDPRKGALTQIFEEYKPDGVPLVIENVVENVDSLVQPVRGTGWQTSHPGDRMVRQELRLILKNNGLPPSGELFDRAYAYIRENY